ncbi:MAG TPA: HIT family protein [Rhizomicrobium sp.]|nr:HIT family protein [Rhizomicrobium sp.]
MFQLHECLAAESCLVGDWTLSRLLLAGDARFPWLILVPRRTGISEIHELDSSDRSILIEEIARASIGLRKMTKATRINIGALGNVVPQLHVHIVARHPGDAAWPGPIWGHGAPLRYESSVRDDLIENLRRKI